MLLLYVNPSMTRFAVGRAETPGEPVAGLLQTIRPHLRRLLFLCLGIVHRALLLMNWLTRSFPG